MKPRVVIRLSAYIHEHTTHEKKSFSGTCYCWARLSNKELRTAVDCDGFAAVISATFAPYQKCILFYYYFLFYFMLTLELMLRNTVTHFSPHIPTVLRSVNLLASVILFKREVHMCLASIASNSFWIWYCDESHLYIKGTVIMPVMTNLNTFK